MGNKKHRAILLIVVAVNAFGALICFIAGDVMQSFYGKELAGEPLPFFTELMLSAVMTWPSAILLASIILFILSFKLKKETVIYALIIMLIIEILLYIYSIIGFIMPMLMGTKELS